MKFLLSFLLFTCLFKCVFGVLPISDLSASVIPNVAQGGAAFAADTLTSPVILPPFGTEANAHTDGYGANSLRYSIDVYYADPIDVTINFKLRPNFRAEVHNCNTRLNFPDFTAWQNTKNTATPTRPSYCAGKPSIAGTSGGAAATVFSQDAGTVKQNTVTLQDLENTITYIEIAAVNTDPTSDDYQFYQIYVLTVSLNKLDGYTMLTLEPESEPTYVYFPQVTSGGEVNQPYASNSGNPGYQLQSLLAESVKDSYPISFYLATQRGTKFIYVQECPGKACADCPVVASRAVITTDTQAQGGCTAGDVTCVALKGSIDTDRSRAHFLSTDRPQYGKYTYPAATGKNGLSAVSCVRFINRSPLGGSNEQTYSFTLKVKNCGEYLNCQSCRNDVDNLCGWCLRDIHDITQGSCEFTDGVVNKQALSRSSAIVPLECVYSARQDQPNRFITAINGATCDTTIKGDPRITGLQGQDFQVHGTPNEYFNLISTKSLQVNSRFVYLDDANCDNFTECFSHPGTYIDEIGVMMGENKVRLVASDMKSAMRVFVNGKEVQVSEHKHAAGSVLVKFANTRRAVVKTPEVMLTVSQSDKFFNVETALLTTSLLDAGSKFTMETSSRATEANTIMHGLIGQTWRNTVYAGNREYEGEVPDYQVADGLWGTDFHFNLYQN